MLKRAVPGGAVEPYLVADGLGVASALDGGAEKSRASPDGGAGNAKGVHGDGGGLNGSSPSRYVVGSPALPKIRRLTGTNGTGIVRFGYAETFLRGLRWEVDRRALAELSPACTSSDDCINYG